MSLKILFCLSVIILLPTQGFAIKRELPKTITDLRPANYGTYTVDPSGTTTISDGDTYGGQVIVGSLSANLKIAKDNNLTINCLNPGEKSFLCHLQSCYPNLVITGNGTLNVDEGGEIDLINGQMLMAGTKGFFGKSIKSISNVSGEINMTKGEWLICGVSTEVNVNPSAAIYLTGGTTNVLDEAVVNLVGGTMKITEGTLNIGNNNFLMSDSGILDLLDMTDFSKISGKINMNYGSDTDFGIYIRYLSPDDINGQTLPTLSGTGFVHVYPNYSNTIKIDESTGIIGCCSREDSKESEELRKYMTEDLGFTTEGKIQFKLHDTATDWLKYVLTSATDDANNSLNSSNYTIDLDSLFTEYSAKDIELPMLQYTDAGWVSEINCKLKCSSKYSVILPAASVTFNNDLSEFEGTLIGKKGDGHDLTFNAEPPSGDIINMEYHVIYNNKQGSVKIGSYNELSTFSIPAGTEVVLVDGSSFVLGGN